MDGAFKSDTAVCVVGLGGNDRGRGWPLSVTRSNLEAILVRLNEKKVSGILVEMESDRDRVRHVIAGVGINVNNSAMPPELAPIASSLKIETGCEFLLDVVRDHVLKQMERYYGMFLERGAKPVIDAFARASSYVRGRRVVVENGDQRSYGVTAGLDPSGVLLLERPGGAIEPVLAGSVRPWIDGED